MNTEAINTACELLATANGLPLNAGEHRCFYCGASCDESHSTRQYVADSFTERNNVAAPGSRFVCVGCVQSMRSDLASVPLIDGTEYRSKADGKRKPKPGAAGVIQMRWFSWVLTESKALAATPAHRQLLHDLCINPPEPPFAICLADGNKHHLYATPVNHSRDFIRVNCEGSIADYSPDQLEDRLLLATKLVSVVGKGSSSIARLMDTESDMGVALQLSRQLPDASELYETWRMVRHEPLSSLALWLAPGKEEANAKLIAGRN